MTGSKWLICSIAASAFGINATWAADAQREAAKNDMGEHVSTAAKAIDNAKAKGKEFGKKVSEKAKDKASQVHATRSTHVDHSDREHHGKSERPETERPETERPETERPEIERPATPERPDSPERPETRGR